jgi:hypothetical protein
MHSKPPIKRLNSYALVNRNYLRIFPLLSVPEYFNTFLEKLHAEFLTVVVHQPIMSGYNSSGKMSSPQVGLYNGRMRYDMSKQEARKVTIIGGTVGR